MGHNAFMKEYGGFDPFNQVFVKRARHSPDSFFTSIGVNNQLPDQGIVIRHNGILVVDKGVDSDTETSRWMIGGDFTGTWSEFEWIFCIDTTFYGMSSDPNIFLLES